MNKVPKNTLSLKQFLLRIEVLKLYKDIFKTIRQVPDESNKKELKEWARYDFRSNMHQTEEMKIKMLIYNGRKSLDELKNSLNLSGSGKVK